MCVPEQMGLRSSSVEGFLLVCLVVWMVSMFPGVPVRDPKSFTLSCGGLHEMTRWTRTAENKLLN